MDGVDFAFCGAALERLTDEPRFFPSPDHRRQAALRDNAGGAGAAELTITDGNQRGVSVASQNGVPGHIREQRRDIKPELRKTFKYDKFHCSAMLR